MLDITARHGNPNNIGICLRIDHDLEGLGRLAPTNIGCVTKQVCGKSNTINHPKLVLMEYKIPVYPLLGLMHCVIPSFGYFGWFFPMESNGITFLTFCKSWKKTEEDIGRHNAVTAMMLKTCK